MQIYHKNYSTSSLKRPWVCLSMGLSDGLELCELCYSNDKRECRKASRRMLSVPTVSMYGSVHEMRWHCWQFCICEWAHECVCVCMCACQYMSMPVCVCSHTCVWAHVSMLYVCLCACCACVLCILGWLCSSVCCFLFTWCFSWMKACINKHEIHIIFELFSDPSIMLEQICIFKTSIIEELNVFSSEWCDQISPRETCQQITGCWAIRRDFTLTCIFEYYGPLGSTGNHFSILLH